MKCPSCQSMLVRAGDADVCLACGWLPEEDALEEVPLYCWMDGARPCSGDCVAWDERQDRDGFSSCKFLNVARSLAQDARRTTEGVVQLSRMAAQAPPPEVK